MTNNKIKGGLYGLLIGDALGVPYEFHMAKDIPRYEKIEMKPPKGFVRSHGVKSGTWSDDGAQALCLLKSLKDKGTLDLTDFTDKMCDWFTKGYMAVDGRVFDIGNQTLMALSAYQRGMPATQSGMINPDGKGNGALMRVLPLALWHTESDEELVEFAHRQCLPTHGAITNQVCCALYCLIARRLLKGYTFDSALKCAVKQLDEIYEDRHEYAEEFDALNSYEAEIWTGEGTGYVVDCLKSAVMIMNDANSYENAIKRAIALGNDTDTTACVVGGLAGIAFGYDDIPERWIEQLRGKDILSEFE